MFIRLQLGKQTFFSIMEIIPINTAGSYDTGFQTLTF